jgi:hypothetical protein
LMCFLKVTGLWLLDLPATQTKFKCTCKKVFHHYRPRNLQWTLFPPFDITAYLKC